MIYNGERVLQAISLAIKYVYEVIKNIFGHFHILNSILWFIILELMNTRDVYFTVVYLRSTVKYQ